MTVDVSKLVSYVAVGQEADGVVVSKLLAYIVIEPGSEVLPTPPPPQNAFSYAQIPRRLTFSAGTTVFGSILLTGDMQSGTDTLLLSGDMQSGTDDEQYSYGA